MPSFAIKQKAILRYELNQFKEFLCLRALVSQVEFDIHKNCVDQQICKWVKWTGYEKKTKSGVDLGEQQKKSGAPPSEPDENSLSVSASTNRVSSNPSFLHLSSMVCIRQSEYIHPSIDE